MKRNKRRIEQTPLDQLFDDPEESIPTYHFRDEDAERRIARMEKNLEPDNYDDLGWGFYRQY